MVDFHTHILPKMDDGSRSSEESAAMLRMLAEQGIKRVVLTPHYYPEAESPEDFLRRRAASFDRLQKAIGEQPLPALHLGAEVRYYDGFSHTPSLAGLMISGSRLMLLEMPFTGWEPRMFREIERAQQNFGCQIILAHIERYLRFQKDAHFWENVQQTGALVQANAEFFLSSMLARRQAIHLLRQGRVHLLGSDCHGIQKRPPRLGEAIHRIGRCLGCDALDAVAWRGQRLFKSYT